MNHSFQHYVIVSTLSVVITLMVVVVLMYVFRPLLATWLLSHDTGTAVDAGATTTPTTMPLAIPDIIATANPAVVSVIATKDVPIYEQFYESLNPFGGWFGEFSVPRWRERGIEEQQVGGGSGFIVSPDGLVVTNRHVVADTDARYSVVMNDGATFPVTVIARDPMLDVAIVRIDSPPANVPTLSFGNSDAVRLGETVIAIGNALAEFKNTVSVGIISGLSRSVEARDARGRVEQLANVFQTDAAINPGNSGGPLINDRGEVIAVNVAASLGAENIGFAIPSNLVKAVVDSVVTYGEIRRPYLGVRYVTITTDIAARESLPVSYGAWLRAGDSTETVAVLADSPAANAGLATGDIIIAIGEVSLKENDLATVLRTLPTGVPLSVRYYRDTTEQSTTVILDVLPTQ